MNYSDCITTIRKMVNSATYTQQAAARMPTGLRTTPKYFRALYGATNSGAIDKLIRVGRAAFCIGAIGASSGCLLTSPYADQSFASTMSQVPIQAWTNNPEGTIKVDCALSTRFGPYWINPDPNWIELASMPVAPAGIPDSKGNLIYSAATQVVVPSNCWDYNDSNSTYYTAIRTYSENSPSSPFYTFHKDGGLECLSEKIGLNKIGATGDWFAWMPSHCVWKDSDGNKIRHVVIRAS